MVTSRPVRTVTFTTAAGVADALCRGRRDAFPLRLNDPDAWIHAVLQHGDRRVGVTFVAPDPKFLLPMYLRGYRFAAAVHRALPTDDAWVTIVQVIADALRDVPVEAVEASLAWDEPEVLAELVRGLPRHADAVAPVEAGRRSSILGFDQLVPVPPGSALARMASQVRVVRLPRHRLELAAAAWSPEPYRSARAGIAEHTASKHASLEDGRARLDRHLKHASGIVFAGVDGAWVARDVVELARPRVQPVLPADGVDELLVVVLLRAALDVGAAEFWRFDTRIRPPGGVPCDLGAGVPTRVVLMTESAPFPLSWPGDWRPVVGGQVVRSRARRL